MRETLGGPSKNHEQNLREDKQMSHYRHLVQEWFDAWNRDDGESAQRAMTTDTTSGYTTTGDRLSMDEWFEFRRRMRLAFPDLRVDVLDVLCEGERVAVQWRFRGRHLGPGPDGQPPTGEAVDFRGSTWWHMSADQIREGFDFWDFGALNRQLDEAAERQASH